MNVGIRELKARLSEYVARASSGEAVVVTDRGRPVARLVPMDEGSSVARGIDEGWIEAPRRSGLQPSVRYRSDSSVAEMLDGDRS